MALVLADRVRDTTTTTGTGTVTLSGTAPTGYQNFSVIGNANTTYYTINAGSQWEVGIGTYSATGPTLSRDTVLESSNANALVNFSAGTKDVFVTYPSDRAVTTDGVETLSNKTVQAVLGAVGTPSYTFTGDLNTGMWSPGADTIAFSEGGVEAMRIDSSGQVGIGTTSPASKLDVNGVVTTGNITARGDGSEGGQITFLNAANSAGPLTLDVDGSGNGRLFTTVNNANLSLGQLVGTGGIVTLNTAAAERMRIDASGNVGIGETSPGAKLHVSGGTVGTTAGNLLNVTIDQGLAGGNAVGVRTNLVRVSSGTDWTTTAMRLQGRVDATNFGYIDLVSGGAQGIAFGSDASERMRITSAGDVGIGTSSPASKLSVSGSFDCSGVGKIGTTVAQAAPSTTDIVSTSNSILGGQGGNAIFVGQYPTTFASWIQSSFQNPTTATYNLALQPLGGNVGIGTASPGAKLDVSSSASNIVASRSTGGYAAFQRVAPAGQFTYDFYTINGVEAARITVTDTNIMAFATGSAATERMRITSAGDVGIGTTAPLARLFAEVPTSVGAAFAYAANSNGVYPTGVFGGSFGYNFSAGGAEVDFWNGWTGATGTQGGFAFRRQTGASSQNLLMTIRGDGNVGIGTSSPGKTLDLVGQFRVSGSAASGYALLEYGTSATTTNNWHVGSEGDGTFRWYNGNFGAGTERMRITSAGNVGVGTSSPAYLLHLNQNGNTQAWISATNAGSNSAGVGFENQGQRNWQIWADRTNDALQFGNNSRATTNMVITSAGNVGIGTTSPVQRLHVRQDQNGTTAALIQNRNGTGSPASALQFISGAFDLSDNRYAMISSAGGSNTTLQFWTGEGAAPAERMRITSAGNVGIGTSSPTERLDTGTGNTRTQALVVSGDQHLIYSASSTELAIRIGTGGPYYGIGTTGSSNMRINSSSGGDMLFAIGGTEHARITNAGNVGIGTSSPGTKLDVVGDIRCTNSMFLGAGQNLDNKIEIGSGRTGSNYAYIDLIGDTTYTDYGLRLIRGNGGANTTSQLVHRGTGDMYITTQDAAPMYFQTNNTTRMYIEAGGTMQMNGSLLVGRSSASTDVNTANDTGSFSVRGNGTTIASMSFHRTGAYAINMGLGTDNVFRIGGWSASSNAFQMDGSGNLTMLGNVTAYSDARIKKDVETIDSALDLVSKMRGVRYTRIDTKKRGVGVIAQEMLEVCPEVVQQGVGDDDTLSVAYGNLVGVLIEAVKELTARVAELEGK